MTIVKGRFYDETKDTSTIFDEQENLRRDPCDTQQEHALFRPSQFKARNPEQHHVKRIEKFRAVWRERKYKKTLTRLPT